MKAPRPVRPALFVAPVPPPVHGGALAMSFLLPLASRVGLRHVNSQFAAGLGDMGRVSIAKLARLVRYGCGIVRQVVGGRVGVVVLTPTFYLGPFLKDSVFIWLSSALLRRRTAAWLHMDFRIMRYESRPAVARWFVRHTLLRCDRFVVVSDGLKELLPSWIPRDRIDVVANGVECPSEMPARRAADNMVRVVYLSNMEPAKGWRVLLAAAKKICADHPEVEFVFHGPPAFQETVDTINAGLAEGNPGGRIRYLGAAYGEAKWRALREADIFCFPSLHEAFPLSVLEAMAAGLPVVATRVGAVADAVTHGHGGLLVEPGNGEALASSLRELIGDQERRQSFGVFNEERYRKEYTVSAYQERWLAWLKANGAAA